MLKVFQEKKVVLEFSTADIIEAVNGHHGLSIPRDASMSSGYIEEDGRGKYGIHLSYSRSKRELTVDAKGKLIECPQIVSK